jgi:20S proteasome alpha/beta subunit
MMTIAAVFNCSDGVVVCADSEETIHDYAKRSTSRKVNVFEYPQIGIRVGLAGAGHSDWIRMFVEKLHPHLPSTPPPPSWTMMQKSIEDFTQDFFAKYLVPYAIDPNQRPQVDMVLAVNFLSSSILYKIVANAVTTEPLFACVGAGQAAMQKIVDSLLKPSLTVRQCASLAIYVMSRVKQEVPGCGGNTNVLMIPQLGNYAWVPTKKIRELEIIFDDIEMRKFEEMAEEIIKQSV